MNHGVVLGSLSGAVASWTLREDLVCAAWKQLVTFLMRMFWLKDPGAWRTGVVCSGKPGRFSSLYQLPKVVVWSPKRSFTRRAKPVDTQSRGICFISVLQKQVLGSKSPVQQPLSSNSSSLYTVQIAKKLNMIGYVILHCTDLCTLPPSIT